MSSSDPSGPPSPDTPGSTADHRYLLDNARAEAGERFAWLAELFDGVTRGHFDRIGVTAGWRCWEVGAGGRSIPEALTAVVGPTGYVLATDIDPWSVRVAAENARVDNGTGNGHSAGTGMEAEVSDGVAKHRDRPEAGLMARGL